VIIFTMKIPNLSVVNHLQAPVHDEGDGRTVEDDLDVQGSKYLVNF